MRIKWVLGICAGVLLILFFSYRLYETIHQEWWNQKKEAVSIALESTDLVKLNKVEPYEGEQTYTIIHGEDLYGRAIIVWVGEEDIHTEILSNNISADLIKADWLSTDPEKELLRMRPGKLDDQYVWEIFFRKRANGKLEYFYNYYNFKDGEQIDTYRLTLR